MAKKPTEKRSHHKPKAAPVPAPVHIEVPFPLEHFDEPPVLAPIPDLPPAPEQFTVKCNITSLGTRFWSGIVFVALKAVDGQDLLAVLRSGQEVTLSYEKIKDDLGDEK